MESSNKKLSWYKNLPEKFILRHREKGIINQPDNLKDYLIETREWVEEVSNHLESNQNEMLVWNVLVEVLFEIRDMLGIVKVFEFSEELPTLIRGVYFEGYDINNAPFVFDADNLRERLNLVTRYGIRIKIPEAFRAVLGVLYNHITEEKLEEIYKHMPKEIKTIWDSSLESLKE